MKDRRAIFILKWISQEIFRISYFFTIKKGKEDIFSGGNYGWE